MIEQYDDFMGGVLTQLYQNHENHKNSEKRDSDFMFKIGAEQYGQLGKALADGDMEKAEQEIFHSAAILFELFIRVKGITNGNGDSILGSTEDIGMHGGDSAALHQRGEAKG
jgi:hypothetical protein